MNELFLQTLPVVTGLSVRECELLKEEWQENLVPQLEKWDTHHQKRWKLFQEQLLQEKKVRPISHLGTPGSETELWKEIVKVLICREYFLCRYTAQIQTQIQTQDGHFELHYEVNIYAVHVDLA